MLDMTASPPVKTKQNFSKGSLSENHLRGLFTFHYAYRHRIGCSMTVVNKKTLPCRASI